MGEFILLMLLVIVIGAIIQKALYRSKAHLRLRDELIRVIESPESNIRCERTGKFITENDYAMIGERVFCKHCDMHLQQQMSAPIVILKSHTMIY